LLNILLETESLLLLGETLSSALVMTCSPSTIGTSQVLAQNFHRLLA
jgi:hypothetical protein